MSEAMQALYAGDAERARKLLRPDEELTVFEAAAFGRVERLTAILEGDPSQAAALSEDGFTALHLAVFGKQRAAAEALLDHGADVNRLSTGPIARVPPLGTAVFVGSVELARLLLERGADVDRRADGGSTALQNAAQSGNAELVSLLLEHGADRAALTPDG